MNGTLYAVGVGPGDPELITLKAARVLESVDVIACPAKDGKPGIAYQIAKEVFPEIGKKEVRQLSFPMTSGLHSQAHDEAVESISLLLSEGKRVAFLTLGDPGFYSAFYYIREGLYKKGFTVEVISGVPSFCAASARLLTPLALGDEQVLITTEPQLDFPGTIIVMKVGRRLQALKEGLASSGRPAYLIENCGMENERVFVGVDSMPDTVGYFSLMIIH